MLGYFQLYFRLESENETSYFMINSDFSKPITKNFYNSCKKKIKKYYDKKYNNNFIIYGCTKEEYEKNT